MKSKLSGAALALVMLSACTPNQVAELKTVATTAVADGQLYCAVASGSGTLTVALQSTTGSAVLAKGNSSTFVNAACGLINAIPVSPPTNPATTPVDTVDTSKIASN